jgi:hypothetical protein
MKARILILSCIILVFFIGVLLIISCERQKEPDFRIVKMTGGNVYINLSKRDPFLNNSEGVEIVNYKDSIHAEILENGDLMYIESDETYFYYRYSLLDGEFLQFSNENSCLYVNGVLKSVFIDYENSNMDCFNIDDIKMLSGIQSLILQGCGSNQCYSLLKRIKASNPTLGLITEPQIQGIDSAMRIIDPVWIVCEELNFNTDYAKNVRQIVFTDGNAEDLYRINNLQNLEEIIIYSEDHPELQNITINSNIRSLVIGLTEDDLSIVSRYPNLQKLVVINDAHLLDISAVSQLKNLNILVLPHEANVKEIQPLHGLEELQWLNFPPNVTDEDLSTIVDHNKKLKVVGISNYNQKLDLEPLTSLDDLIGLNIYGNSFDIESLKALKQLGYLGIPKEILYDSTNFAQLRANLSDTLIVPNNIGICLGTGWILIFIPVLAIVFFLFSAFRRKI